MPCFGGLQVRRILPSFINPSLNCRVVFIWLFSGLKWGWLHPFSPNFQCWITTSTPVQHSVAGGESHSVFHFKWAQRAALPCFPASCQLPRTLHSSPAKPSLLFPRTKPSSLKKRVLPMLLRRSTLLLRRSRPPSSIKILLSLLPFYFLSSLTYWGTDVPIPSPNQPSQLCPWFHLLFPLVGPCSCHDHNLPASPVLLCP